MTLLKRTNILSRIGSPVGMVLRCLVGVVCFYSSRALLESMSMPGAFHSDPFKFLLSLSFGLPLTGLLLLLSVIMVPFDIIAMALNIAIWFLSKLELKGVLLLLGTLLFLFAKGILVAHGLNELHVSLPWPLKLL